MGGCHGLGRRCRALLRDADTAYRMLGFAELLADPDLSLTAKTRLEYARIVQASGQRLERAICEMVERVAAEQGENAEP